MAKKILVLAYVFSTLLTLHAAAADGPWPQWRGPNRDDLSIESGLLQSWPAGGPEQLWSNQNIGVGYSGPAVVGSRMYLMGVRDGEEMLLCLDVATGDEVWASAVGKEFENNWGNGPRGTPTVEGKFVYALSGGGNLGCYQLDNGEQVWVQALQDFGGKVPVWGYSESPLIHQEKLLITPGGGEGAIVALDKATGELLWQTKELTDDAHYSSMMLRQKSGKTMGVQLLVSQLVGFDVQTGELLWSQQWPGRVAVIPTPVFWRDCVYVTSGYGTGCMLVKIADDFSTEVIYDNRFMSNHHGGVILLDDHIFGHADKKGWACQDIATGKKVWLERDSLDKGAIAYADGRFYCYGEDSGEVVLIEASTDGWQQHGRFKFEPQSDLRKPKGRIWTHPVIADGRLYLRDQELLYCYDIRAK